MKNIFFILIALMYWYPKTSYGGSNMCTADRHVENFSEYGHSFARYASMDSVIFGTGIPMDSVGNGLPPFTITEPGAYYFTEDIYINTGSITDGIRIEASQVTIDMNGFGLIAASWIDSENGINIIGAQAHITIKNGMLRGWDGDGIKGAMVNESTFDFLKVRNVEGNGIVANMNCLIQNCHTNTNGGNGVTANDGSMILDCIARENGGDGFQVNENSSIFRCKAVDNKANGFDVAAHCRIEDCHANENEVHGFDLELGANAFDCVADGNGGNGFDLKSANSLVRSKAAGNGFCIDDVNCVIQPTGTDANSLGDWGNGVRASANCRIIDSEFSDNERVGIRISSAQAYVSNNTCLSNNNVGVYGETSGSLYLKNVCHNNGVNSDPGFTQGGTLIQGNYSLNASDSFGPIINFNGVGDVSNITNSDHPFANFEY